METGDNLYTFLSAGDSVKRTCSIYWGRLLLFTQLAMLLTIPQIVWIVVMKATVLEDESFETVQTLSPQKVLVNAIGIIFPFLFGIIIPAAIIQVVADIYTQQLSTLKGSFRVALHRFRPIFCFGLLFSFSFLAFFVAISLPIALLVDNPALTKLSWLASLLLFSAILIPLFVMLSLMIILPILVVEKQSPIRAIKRSFELVSGYRCYIFCSMLLLVVITGAGTLIYRGILLAIFGPSVFAYLLMGISVVVALPLHTM